MSRGDGGEEESLAFGKSQHFPQLRDLREGGVDLNHLEPQLGRGQEYYVLDDVERKEE